jgi:excinuclease ABC subunit C
VFVNGRPEKARYRTYKLKQGGVGEPDDFASMYEVLSRRFRRGLEAEKAAAAPEGEEGAAGSPSPEDPWRLPDLIVIDGGKGQLGSALAAARDTGVDVRPGLGLPIVALAKERDFAAAGAPAHGAPGDPPAQAPAQAKDRRPDRVFLPNVKDPIPIRPNSAEMYVLARLRDEAHRFAVGFHRSQRKRRTLRSALADVPGIGPSRQRALLQHFGSVRKIREASVDDLATVAGMTRKSAEAVAAHFAGAPAAAPAESAPAPEPGPGALAVVPSAEEVEEEALESQFAGVEEPAAGEDAEE